MKTNKNKSPNTFHHLLINVALLLYLLSSLSPVFAMDNRISINTMDQNLLELFMNHLSTPNDLLSFRTTCNDIRRAHDRKIERKTTEFFHLNSLILPNDNNSTPLSLIQNIYNDIKFVEKHLDINLKTPDLSNMYTMFTNFDVTQSEHTAHSPQFKRFFEQSYSFSKLFELITGNTDFSIKSKVIDILFRYRLSINNFDKFFIQENFDKLSAAEASTLVIIKLREKDFVNTKTSILNRLRKTFLENPTKIDVNFKIPSESARYSSSIMDCIINKSLYLILSPAITLSTSHSTSHSSGQTTIEQNESYLHLLEEKISNTPSEDQKGSIRPLGKEWMQKILETQKKNIVSKKIKKSSH